MEEGKREKVRKLQQDILAWEGFRPHTLKTREVTGLQQLEAAFPNGVFPLGAIHEFLSFEPEQAAASEGFIACLTGALMQRGGVCLWIAAGRQVFPAELKVFGVPPEKIIFIDLSREKDVLWVLEEALKTTGLAAVVGEVRALDFMQARRLQLAVETSKVTGFILRTDARHQQMNSCMARWQVSPIPSQLETGMPGVGFPRWQIDLLKVRNGKPGSWQVEWSAGRLNLITENPGIIKIPAQRAG